jgi:hypothetical protein
MVRMARWRDDRGVGYRTMPAVFPDDVVMTTLDFDDTPLDVDATPQQRMQRGLIFFLCINSLKRL